MNRESVPSAGECARNPGEAPRAVRRIFAGREDSEPRRLRKAQILRENLEHLEALPQATFAEFAADFRNVQSALHLLQTSVQALIDIGSFHCAKLGLATPRSSHEVFQRLEADHRLPPGTAKRVEPIIGFRNRVVVHL